MCACVREGRRPGGCHEMLALLICSTSSRRLLRCSPHGDYRLLVTPASPPPCLFLVFSSTRHTLPSLSSSCLFLFPLLATTPPLHSATEYKQAGVYNVGWCSTLTKLGQATNDGDSHRPDLDSYISIQRLHVSFLQKTHLHPCQSDPTSGPARRLISSHICISSTLQAHAPTTSLGYPSPTLGCA